MGLALIKSIDDAVGGVMAKLREHGLEENTLVLFASDNGAPTKMGRNGPGLPGGPPGTRGGVWNGSNNVPMRGEKGSLFEGGIRVPMFAYWKGKIMPGTVIEEMVTTLDLTATTLKAGGGAIPDEFDGVDLLPRLTGKSGQDRPAKADVLGVLADPGCARWRLEAVALEQAGTAVQCSRGSV